MIPRYSRPEIANIWSDENKFRIWLNIEILACEAMHKLGKIPARDLLQIKRKANFNVKRIEEIEKKVNHDVIAFLTNVAEYVGHSARYIHKGMTSSDVLDTALAVQMVQAGKILLKDINAVRLAAAEKAKKYMYTPMIGRTHGVHAEPITFGLKMALMFDEFGRAMKRLENAVETISVGQLSGAVGTHAHLDPFVEKYVCQKLKLRPATISTQILQRDRHAEYMCSLALIGCSVDRWATELRHLQRTEVLEIEEFFGSEQKGSSAMPHKKNPITAEKLSGLSRLLRGNAIAAMENVALWHERDISHSSVERIIIPDSTIALDHILINLANLIKNMKVYTRRMEQNLNLTHGLIHSQQVLLKLTEKGISRENAYRMVQKHAMKSWETSEDFRSLLESDHEITKILSRADFDEVFSLNTHFKDIKRTFKLLGL